MLRDILYFWSYILFFICVYHIHNLEDIRFENYEPLLYNNICINETSTVIINIINYIREISFIIILLLSLFLMMAIADIQTIKNELTQLNMKPRSRTKSKVRYT
jgi:hypothetical protein